MGARVMRRIGRWCGKLVLCLFLSSLLAVVVYKYVPVYYTPLMLIRLYERHQDGKELRLEHEWVPMERIAPREMERISLLKTPSDILAVVEMPDYGSTETFLPEDWVLALDDVQDPGNMGTIIRLADWFGIRDIFCSEATVDCFNPKVVQATMGAIARVRVHYVPLPKFLQRMSSDGIPVYGTFLEGDNIYDTELPATGVLVMGNEGQGISTAVGQQTTRKLYIPSYPADAKTSESLNVAVATAVATAEIRRRLR